jgi:hypothetical protein
LNSDLNFSPFGHYTSHGKLALLLSSLAELWADFDKNGLYKMMTSLNVMELHALHIVA